MIKSIRKKMFLYKLFDAIYNRSKINYIKKHFWKVWNNLKIFWNIFFQKGENIIIWDNVRLNELVLLNWGWWIEIKDNVTISSWAQIISTWLDIKNLEKYIHIKNKIIIWKWSWICSSVVIAWNVKIWEWSVISANSFLNKNVWDKELWWWNPAQFIKKI